MCSTTFGRKENNPLCSPLKGNFEGLPPLYVFASNEEILFDDISNSVKKAQDAKVDVTFIVKKGLCHAYPLFTGMFPEADPDRLLEKLPWDS
jgi:epsilon-lactone hydrolase